MCIYTPGFMSSFVHFRRFTGLSTPEVVSLLSEERYLNSEGALKHGIVDSVIPLLNRQLQIPDTPEGAPPKKDVPLSTVGGPHSSRGGPHSRGGPASSSLLLPHTAG